MKNKRFINLITIFLFILVSSLLVGSVFSIWNFGNAENVQSQINVFLAPWTEFPPTTEGQNNSSTVDKVNEAINGNPDYSQTKSIIDDKIERFGHYSSEDAWDGDDVRQELGLPENTSFLIEPDATNQNIRYLYTTNRKIGTTSGGGFFKSTANFNIPTTEDIYAVYRTKMVKNLDGEWETVESLRGYAKPSVYTSGLFNQLECCSIDASSWNPGKLGTSFNNAVYIYQGEALDMSVDNPNEEMYFKVMPNKNGNITVALENDCKATIYDANHSIIIGPDKQVTFSAIKGVTYYIKVNGAANIKFAI